MAFPGGNFQGSAWVIGKRAILTAGHCVHDSGGWASKIVFMPQYDNGPTVDSWTVTKMTSLKEWVDNENLDFDMAACILDRDISQVTGIAGYVVNQSPTAYGRITGAGYPAKAQDGFPFDGEEMWRSIGALASDEMPGTTNDRNYGAFNDMSGGCSGGPWFTEGSNPVACGLNSHIFSDTAGNPVDVPRQMRSPYFGKGLLRLIQWLKENGGEPVEPGGGLGNIPVGGGGEGSGADLKSDFQKIVDDLQSLVKRLS